MGSLDNLTILVPESRELNLFATMIEEEGARVIRCPLVQILDLDDSREAEAWLDALIGGAFEDVIWLTGEGLRRLLALARRTRRGDAFVAALSKIRSITRGPKPARALREIGLAPGLSATTPTSEGVLAALAPEDITGTAHRRSALSGRRHGRIAFRPAHARRRAHAGDALPLRHAG